MSKEFDELPDDMAVLQGVLREAKLRLGRTQPELDVRQATLEIIKKEAGTDPNRLANAEKAQMVTSLRSKCKLCEPLPVVGMAKGGYGYARGTQARGEGKGRAAARRAVVKVFSDSGRTYGYRRVCAQVNADARGAPRSASGPRAAS